MSTHKSLRPHRGSTRVTDRHHPGQRAASPRKRASQARRAILDEAEAMKLGISVPELHVRRYRATQAMLARQRADAAAAERARERELAQRRSRWGY